MIPEISFPRQKVFTNEPFQVNLNIIWSEKYFLLVWKVSEVAIVPTKK